MGQSNRIALDNLDALELALEILSFAGGENTIGEDQATKINQARVIKNWNLISLGGMERMPGINKIGDGGAGYATFADMMIQHKDSGGTVLYGAINGDSVKLVGTVITQDDIAAFSTPGTLLGAVSVLNNALWVTSQVDDLMKKTVGNAIAAATDQPAQKYARIYNHKSRLLVEGGVTNKNRVEICRAGIGNWDAADAWSLANDACSIDLPEDTRGCVPGFPGGNDVLVFTENECFAIYNFPQVAFRPFVRIGNAAPHALALGDEGVYFVSRRPNKGVFLMSQTGEVKELTQFNRDVFTDKIDFSGRVLGVYRNRRYYLFYNESNSGVTYPNRCRIYDARFEAWIERPINMALGEAFGIPTVMKYNEGVELYVASSIVDKWYEMEVGTDDEGEDTQATYKTKDFSSRDFALARGGQFPIDDVRMKFIDLVITFNGNSGTFNINWETDRGLHSGSKVVTLTSTGFVLGSSLLGTGTIGGSPTDKTVVIKLPNTCVGKRINLTFVNNGQGTRPKIKKVKLRAIALEEA